MQRRYALLGYDSRGSISYYYNKLTPASVGGFFGSLLLVKHLDSGAHIRAGSDRWSDLQNTGAVLQTMAPPLKQEQF